MHTWFTAKRSEDKICIKPQVWAVCRIDQRKQFKSTKKLLFSNHHIGFLFTPKTRLSRSSKFRLSRSSKPSKPRSTKKTTPSKRGLVSDHRRCGFKIVDADPCHATKVMGPFPMNRNRGPSKFSIMTDSPLMTMVESHLQEESGEGTSTDHGAGLDVAGSAGVGGWAGGGGSWGRSTMVCQSLHCIP